MKSAHIQAIATEDKHPELVRWWSTAGGDKSAVVRMALEWWFDVRPQLDRIEEMLRKLVEVSSELD